jgi:hypothetical protein
LDTVFLAAIILFGQPTGQPASQQKTLATKYVQYVQLFELTPILIFFVGDMTFGFVTTTFRTPSVISALMSVSVRVNAPSAKTMKL